MFILGFALPKKCIDDSRGFSLLIRLVLDFSTGLQSDRNGLLQVQGATQKPQPPDHSRDLWHANTNACTQFKPAGYDAEEAENDLTQSLKRTGKSLCHHAVMVPCLPVYFGLCRFVDPSSETYGMFMLPIFIATSATIKGAKINVLLTMVFNDHSRLLPLYGFQE